MDIDVASTETPDLILTVIDSSVATMTIKANEALEAGCDEYDTLAVHFPGIFDEIQALLVSD